MKTINLSILLLLSAVIACTTPARAAVINSFSHHQQAPAVEAWFFRAVSGYPAAIAFEPVVLFKNGDYVDVGDEPIEDMDVAASKKKRPKAWGTWKKTGEVYFLTNYKSKTHDYKLGTGNWFPAFAYSAAAPLKKSYKKTSGGNYGNGTVALVINKITFVDATHFTMGSNSGISTPAAVAGQVSSTSGTYKLFAHSIILTYDDGKVEKRSFALGASGRPPKATNTMIFIGGDAFTDTE